jgi:hypothetical protein
MVYAVSMMKEDDRSEFLSPSSGIVYSKTAYSSEVN